MESDLGGFCEASFNCNINSSTETAFKVCPYIATYKQGNDKREVLSNNQTRNFHFGGAFRLSNLCNTIYDTKPNPTVQCFPYKLIKIDFQNVDYREAPSPAIFAFFKPHRATSLGNILGSVWNNKCNDKIQFYTRENLFIHQVRARDVISFNKINACVCLRH